MPASSTTPPAIATLLNLVPTPNGPSQVLTHLTSHPTLASAADQNGYNLLHAAASYNALDLLRVLVRTYHADPNITDNDGDTPLFHAETVEAAKCLVEELGANTRAVNEEGEDVVGNARTNAEDGEAGWESVVAYLEAHLAGPDSTPNGLANGTTTPTTTATNGAHRTESHAPPPLPNNIRMNIMSRDELDAESLGEADPEFRARIEALAARGDFGETSGQRDLRRLVEEAVGGLEGADDAGGGGGGKRRAG